MFDVSQALGLLKTRGCLASQDKATSVILLKTFNVSNVRPRAITQTRVHASVHT